MIALAIFVLQAPSKYVLVARAASARLIAAGRDGSKAVGEVVIDNPWRLVRAHVRITTITSGCSVGVCQRRVVLVAGGDWVRDISLAGP